MKTLTVENNQFQAERIVKTDTDIVGYVGDKIEFSFKGISDFTGFTLAEGETWDIDLSPEVRIKALEEALLMIL